MHGMLSAAVMLAVFDVIALAGGASAVWLFRAATGTPRRSRSTRLTGMPCAAAGPAPGAPNAPGVPGVPAEEPDGLEAEYPERSRPGAALAAPAQLAGSAQLAGPAVHDGLAGSDDPAAPPGVGDAYDLQDWPGAADTGDGPSGPSGYGRSSPGPRAWPDTAKSLYSRGWPAMDSSPPVRDPQQTPNGPEAGAAQEPDIAEEEAPPGRPEGARVYVLGESRRPGR